MPTSQNHLPKFLRLRQQRGTNQQNVGLAEHIQASEQRGRQRTARTFPLPAPVQGLTDDAFTEDGATACRMINFIPTRTGIIPRPGITKLVDKRTGRCFRSAEYFDPLRRWR